jgi:hypothetical protein
MNDKLRKWLLPLAAVLALTVTALAPIAPAEAASRFQFRQNDGGNNGGPFNIDQDPCKGQGGHPHLDSRGRMVCGDDQGNSGRNDGFGNRRPGPSAFGLQFDGSEN